MESAPLPGVPPGSPLTAAPEVTTVGDDFAVVFWGAEWKRYDGLAADTDHSYDGVSFRTLPRPGGERLATVATVNDVHFGETVCGIEESLPNSGPVFSSEPGEPPYPETMNGAAVEEMLAVSPDAVVVKGDLTADGTEDEYQAFLRCYHSAFGDRLHHVRGNHDAYRHQSFAPEGPRDIRLPGATLAVLDTTVPGSERGAVPADQLAWLDEVAREAADEMPVLVFGHHHVWDPASRSRPETYFGVNPDDSERLVELAARRPALAGYFAGHTHRNRVRRFATTGPMPWVEVACVKDFPGVWSEYRIFEGGVLQITHRIRRADALAWSERTRVMFGGLYEGYAFGSLSDRCFSVEPRVLPLPTGG